MWFALLACCIGYSGKKIPKKFKFWILTNKLGNFEITQCIYFQFFWCFSYSLKEINYVLFFLRIANDWGCVLFYDSYAPGLGQSGGGRPSDMDYVDTLMGHNELAAIDENLNLDHLNGFGFSEFMQTYKPQ